MTWASGLWRRVVPAVLVHALLLVSVLVALRVARPANGQLSTSIPPPPDGYISLLPVGFDLEDERMRGGAVERARLGEQRVDAAGPAAFEVVAPVVLVYLKKAQTAFKTILANPIGFVRNLIAAANQIKTVLGCP